jgi:hypothetical protein
LESPGGKYYLAFVMHYTAGLILSVVFQLAHVVETTNPSPNELGEMDNNRYPPTFYRQILKMPL